MDDTPTNGGHGGNHVDNRIHRTANAKINLSLHVTGRRNDGYHTLDSLVAFTGFGDTVDVSSSDEDTLAFTGTYGAALAEDDGTSNNLVIRARDWLRDQLSADRACPPVAITLQKNIPIASGIGGGSADAAAVLHALAKQWKAMPNVLEDYPAIAAALGADMPMCLMNRPLRAQGIGEALAPVPHMPLLPVVLANTGRPVSTPDVFKALSHASGTPMPAMPPSFRSAQHAADWLSGHTRNDLQEAAMGLCPDIADTLAALSRSGAVFTRMSGSGATCFGLFETVEDAQDAATWLAAVETEWFVEATCLLPSPPLQDEDYPAWADWMKTARSLHSTSPS